MPNNKPDQIRKKLYEDYENSLFRLIMHDVAEKEGSLFREENEKLKNNQEFLPSEEELQRFKQQLDLQLKKPKLYARRQRILKVLNRAAIAMFVIIIILLTTTVSVQAVRVKVLNLLMNIQPKFTSFQLEDSTSDSSGGKPLVNWTKTYVPTYIPEGYKVSSSTNNELLKKIVFENPDQKDLPVIYTELSEGNNSEVDTENASVFKSVSINGHKGTLVVKNSLVTIVWEMNNHMFIIQAKTSEDTAMKIAKGVKYEN